MDTLVIDSVLCSVDFTAKVKYDTRRKVGVLVEYKYSQETS